MSNQPCRKFMIEKQDIHERMCKTAFVNFRKTVSFRKILREKTVATQQIFPGRKLEKGHCKDRTLTWTTQEQKNG